MTKHFPRRKNSIRSTIFKSFEREKIDRKTKFFSGDLLTCAKPAFSLEGYKADLDIITFSEALNSITTKLFIDLPSFRLRNLFNLYYLSIAYFKDNNHKESCELVYSAIKRLAHFYEEFLTRDNVFILAEVSTGLCDYFNMIKKRIADLHHHRSLETELKKPINILKSSVIENSDRTQKIISEYYPLINIIYQLIPRSIDAYSLNEKESKLIATSIVCGLMTGSDIDIITYKSVALTLASLPQTLSSKLNEVNSYKEFKLSQKYFRVINNKLLLLDGPKLKITPEDNLVTRLL